MYLAYYVNQRSNVDKSYQIVSVHLFQISDCLLAEECQTSNLIYLQEPYGHIITYCAKTMKKRKYNKPCHGYEAVTRWAGWKLHEEMQGNRGGGNNLWKI